MFAHVPVYSLTFSDVKNDHVFLTGYLTVF